MRALSTADNNGAAVYVCAAVLRHGMETQLHESHVLIYYVLDSSAQCMTLHWNIVYSSILSTLLN